MPVPAFLRHLLARRFWGRWFAAGGVATWLAEPAVRRAVNRRVTGSPHVWPVEWLDRHLRERFPERVGGRALSVGCGTGALERDLVAKGLVREVVGVDLSPTALEIARERAREELGEAAGRVRYLAADLDAPDLLAERFEDGAFDLVLAHQALHHVRELEGCFARLRDLLAPGGLLYLDEYVGPSRSEWSRRLLAPADALYRSLPPRARRRRRLQLPVDRRDPSEAIRSSAILPVLAAAGFEVLERRDYGGNLLSVVHPHLALDRLRPEERHALLGRLLEEEDRLLAAGEPSYYTVVLARRA